VREALSQLTEPDVSYEQWKRVECPDGKKRIKIVNLNTTREDFSTLVLKELDEFHEHVNRVHTQHAANDRLKKNLPVGECIVQMDFSENYTCQNMDEIQSAYWTNASITLHPVVVWFKADDKAESFQKLRVCVRCPSPQFCCSPDNCFKTCSTDKARSSHADKDSLLDGESNVTIQKQICILSDITSRGNIWSELFLELL